jgi:phenylpropionate dioxygenase-like ring-hydroxylating dioxygenase large terminal subunit
VWCCLENPAVDLPLPEALRGVEWTHGTGRPMSVAAGPRAATENFRDVAHFPFVHRSTMGHIPQVVEPLDLPRGRPMLRVSANRARERRRPISPERPLPLHRADPAGPAAGEAPLDPADQVHTPADRYTLEYRRAFIEFVREVNTRAGVSAIATAAFEPAT